MEMDLKTKLFFAEAVEPEVIGADGASVGNIIDTALFESLTFLFAVADYTSGTYTVTIEDGDDSGLSDTAAVLITDDPQTLIPASAGPLVLAAAGIRRFGYIGKKRFVRITITTADFSVTGATILAYAIQGNAKSNPTTDQGA